jgi:hypothetical protein
MYGGNVFCGNKESSYYVWPVRAGQCGPLDYSAICLPKTGPTTCHDTVGDTITCAGTGQDGELQNGVAGPDPRFIDNGDSTVTDNLTGLEWTKDANSGGSLTWQAALDYVRTLNTGGHSDWRLPNRKELHSLVDYARHSPALPQSHPFTNVQSFDYWSSTSYALYSYYAWLVNLIGGFFNSNDKTVFFYVWPVRAGQVDNSTILTTTTTVGSTTSVPTITTTQPTTTTTQSTTTTTAGSSTTTSTGPSTTTTTQAPAGCIDKDGDGYGDNCTAGPDCDDNDSFYNKICPDCTVKVIPRARGWFLGEKEKTRRLLVIGPKGTVFDQNTPVRWETCEIAVLSKCVLFKRFMFMKVSIDGAALGKGDYRALIGTCSGKLTLVK